MTSGSADIAILGAGVMGASVAFHLARRNAGRVVVIEKDEVAFGASGRSSALVRMHYSFPPEVQLAVKSLEIFKNWPDVVGRPGDFKATGFVRIVRESEMDLLKANVAMQQSLGVNTRVVTGAELREIEPDWIVDDVPAAAYEPESGYGDGAAVATDFLARAREMGVLYRPRTRVTGFRMEGDRVRGVETDSGLIEAPIVVAATGPWTAPLFRAIGVSLPIEPEYHEVAILRNPPRMKPRGSACIDSMTTTYFRSEGGGHTLVGGFYGRRGVDPDLFPRAASPEGVVELARAAAGRIPALQDASLMRGIAGIYDMTPDARPLLGEVPGVAGLHVVAGFSGMGFKISPAVGLVMAELLTDGAASSVDIRPFRPSRFAEGQPIKGPFEYTDD